MRTPLVIIAIALLSACDSQDRRDRQVVQAQQAQYAVAQPIPTFDWSLERDIITQLYHARNERVATHTVWRGDTSQIEGDCPSIGYPLPYDTSLTNPLAPYYWGSGSSGMVVEQAEPNGIFASKNSIATWVRCVVEVNGKRVEAPIYVEGKVTAYPYPVEVDYEADRAIPVSGAEPSVTIEPKGSE
jgi:hypothetical protein